MKNSLNILFLTLVLISCKKKDGGTPLPQPVFNISVVNALLNNDPVSNSDTKYGVNPLPQVVVRFSGPVSKNTVAAAVTLADISGNTVAYQASYLNDSALVVQPQSALAYLNKYVFKISTALKSASNGNLSSPFEISLQTRIDSSNKFPVISNDSLLSVVQRQTFKYFWDFGHPVSGLARERNTSGDLVTSGGSGFGIMSIIVADSRGFITHAEALVRMQKIVTFLKDKGQKFHGAFPHWLNGVSGNVIPFSAKDDGGDLVETSFLMQGLLCARQYFNAGNAAETTLRTDINTLWNGVEWDWYRKGNENVLYWHWSPTYNWEMNAQVRGWNESLITYVLAASSTTHNIPKAVYDQGWTRSGAMKNGNTYYGIQLPLGPPLGGPLFFAHYSFLGINPTLLTDAYADYWDQNRSHTLINYNYCVANPRGYYGYSSSNWGLTASDDINGYKAHEPNNDNSVISPTAALSSFPYSPTQSMQALKFFYYTMGDKLWKEYGFIDAFSLHERWFANSFLAIDQGPIIVMIENHRSGLLWNLFMSCPEVKTGMKALGFSSPHL